MIELLAAVALLLVVLAGVVFSLTRPRDDDEPAVLEAGRSHMRVPRRR